MKKLVKATLATIGISVFYIVLSAVLAFTENSLKISLRTWADVLGKVTAALVTPLLIIVMLAVWIHRRTRIHSAIKGIVTFVIGLGYLFWAYWAVLIIAFGVQDERLIAPKLLVTNEAEFLSPSEYVYYRPVAIFFKTPAELTDEIKIEYLDRKYDREFMTDVSESGFLCDREFPDVKVSVYLSSMELSDDYVKQMTLKYLAEGYEILGIKRKYHIAKNYSNKDDLLYMEFDGEADIRALAGDISQMISYCMEHTELFKEYYGNIGVSSYEGEHEITFTLPFGKMMWWDKDDDYYRDLDGIADIVTEKYLYYADRYAQIDEQAQQVREEETEIQETAGSIEWQADYVEEDARALYDAVFAEEGYSYDVHYNAKGNFYVDLGEKDGYFYSLVYDHPSQNGACELFVLYRSTEKSDSDVIVDMYAVENATKRVVASGRKSWSDVGTKEYREITEQDSQMHITENMTDVSESEAFSEDSAYDIDVYGRIEPIEKHYSDAKGEEGYYYTIDCLYFADNEQYKAVNETLRHIYDEKEKEYQKYCEDKIQAFEADDSIPNEAQRTNFFKWFYVELPYVGEDYVSIMFNDIGYSAGAAHPYSYMSPVTISIKTGDIVTAEEILNMSWNMLQEKTGYQDEEEFYQNYGFYLTDNTLTFVYRTSPYVDEIVIPR